MNRLTEGLQRLRQEGGKALALFLTAGYPARGDTPDLVKTLVEAGADIIELGMPFSDPLADGPVIQESSLTALKNGVTLPEVLTAVETIRKWSSVPVVLMGYVNPILRYGPERFFQDAASAGVDGVILPEVPLEETWRFDEANMQAGLSRILLVSPTTSPERMRAIDAAASGFVYCVSATGVTGGSTAADREYLRRVRREITRNPLLVGFGISSAADARTAACAADGVIIGSALLRLLREGADNRKLSTWVHEMKGALAPPPDRR